MNARVLGVAVSSVFHVALLGVGYLLIGRTEPSGAPDATSTDTIEIAMIDSRPDATLVPAVPAEREPQATSTEEAAPESTPVPERIPEPSPDPGSTFDIGPDIEPRPEERAPESKSIADPRSESEAVPESIWTTTSGSEVEAGPEPKPEPEPAEKAEAETGRESIPESTREPEPVPERSLDTRADESRSETAPPREPTSASAPDATMTETIGGASSEPTTDAVVAESDYQHRLRAAIAARRHYPRQARRRRQEGTVVVGFRVLADGTLDRLEVRASSGIAALDEAALEAVRGVGTFEPFPDDMARPSLELTLSIGFGLS